MNGFAEASAGRFTTARVPVDERVERWEAWNGSRLLGLRATPAQGTTLDAAQIACRVPGGRVARVRASAHQVTRGAGEIASSPTSAVAVFLPFRSTSHFEAGRTQPLTPGFMLVCDADRPFARAFPDGVDEFVFALPCPERVVLPEPAVVRLDGPGSTQALATALAHDLVAGIGRAWRLRALVEALLDDLLGNPHPPDRIALARAFIAQRLLDPSLSAATIAAALTISERQLSRTLADAGTSVPREILGQRLHHARILIEREPHIAPGDVARRSGIRSASYFTRQFTAHFGTTPGRWVSTSHDDSSTRSGPPSGMVATSITAR